MIEHLPPADGFLPKTAVDREIARQAVTWLVELQTAAPGSGIEQAIRDWRARDPAHEAAWQHIETVNARLGSLASPLGSALARAALSRPASRSRRQAIKLLAGALFAGGSLLAVERQTPWPAWVADERSGTGQRRRLQLADGSRLLLNSDSAVNLVFSAKTREVQLLRGEILVDTGRDEAHAPPRRFRVTTPHGELTPLGTRFAVRLHDDRTRLDVFAGAVEIRPAGDRRRLTVDAGESAEFAEPAVLATGHADADRIAWQDEMLVASRMRLADFVAELDRHRRGRLHCDPAVGELRISGSFPLADPERILDALRSTLPVEIHYLTRYWATVRPAARG
ncbi:FecR family protein [Azonexus fungiphilus]|uniref:FecR family protein n=1 Tax=Azonexus fungiphilus TaxID=146940 RepID=A0A495VL66_9RHOO|nr:FecR domain-containing protein [Azonexus fungiphilus]RKT49640.1 FecR family protein [Azonexus fungiphilus]